MEKHKISEEEKDENSRMLFEAAVLVEFANNGKKKIIPDLMMYKDCLNELALIALQIKRIRSKGYGKCIKPNQYTN